MIDKFKWLLLSRLIRWAIRGYKWDVVLGVFWKEFRCWYSEDNLPSALASVREALEECEKDK